jgi:ribosome-binding protein aMBF1 (putative translation factor)
MSSTVDRIQTEIGNLENHLAGLPDALRTGAQSAAYRSRLEKLRAELASAERSQAASRAVLPASDAGDAAQMRDEAVRKLAKSIGIAARQARTALELTQEDAAERLAVSVDFYARIERGNSLPSVPTLARMVAVLGVSADALLGRIAFEPGAAAAWSAAASPTDPPEVRRVSRMLRRASPGSIRLVALLLRELERHTGGAVRDDGSDDASAGEPLDDRS